MLHSAVYYPANYGFVPRTFCDDGDPLDALVLGQEPVHPLTVVDARAIGVMRMRDEKGLDDKILAVSVNDPAFVDYTTHTQLPAHALREIRRFFQDYKTLENKQVVVEDFMGPEDAVRILEEALDLYRKLRRGEVDRRKSMSPAPMLFATYPLWFNVTTVVVFVIAAAYLVAQLVVRAVRLAARALVGHDFERDPRRTGTGRTVAARSGDRLPPAWPPCSCSRR